MAFAACQTPPPAAVQKREEPQINPAPPSPKTVGIGTDSVYPGKNYQLELISLDTLSEDETLPNTVFRLLQKSNGTSAVLYADSVYSQMDEVAFTDFTGDGVKDILLQFASSARSNQMYHLYTVDTARDRITEIRGFTDIANPRFLPQYNLIDNYVLSGTNWTGFYRIDGDTVADFGVVVYDPMDESETYEREYDKALQKIGKRRKTGRNRN